MERAAVRTIAMAIALAGVNAACVGDEPTTAPVDDAAVTIDAGSGDATTLDAPSAMDSGSDVQEASADGGTTPASFGSELVVWLDADRGLPSMGTHVSSWTDQSTHNNSAQQLATSNQPVVETGINGHKAVRFDGAATYLTIDDGASLNWGTDDFAIFVVAKYVNVPSADPTTSSGYFWVKTVGTPSYAGVLFAGNRPGSIATAQSSIFTWVEFSPAIYAESTSVGYNDGAFHVFATRRSAGTMLEVRVDGAQVGESTIASINVSSTGQPAYIGGLATQSFLNGDIAELVAIDGPLSTSDVGHLESYLRAKYGL